MFDERECDIVTEADGVLENAVHDDHSNLVKVEM
jgi:hypothetical protein